MEFNFEEEVCSKCTGIDKCTKACILHSGKALIDFIKRIDTVETKIGEYSSRKKGTKPDLVVCGHQIFELNSPSIIYKDISTELNISHKFLEAYEKNAFQIAKIYCKHEEISAEEEAEITKKIRAINNSKMLIIPFKPHDYCEVDLEMEGKVDKKVEATISNIKWITNPDTHKLDCIICFCLNKSAQVQYYKLNIKEYINKFRLSQMEMMAKGSKHDSKLIKITDHGIFKPIVIKEGDTTVAIDGTYVYYTVNSETNIIGYWDTKDKLAVKKIPNSKALAKILDNEEYIKNHKKYIAPYMLYEPNIISVK